MVRASLQGMKDAEFVEAATGLEAIEHLAVAPIELVLLDLNMPDMHGIDVLRFVRAQQRHKSMPIVVLTTRSDDASRTAAGQAGATAYVTKPFAPAALAETVKGLLPTGGPER